MHWASKSQLTCKGRQSGDELYIILACHYAMQKMQQSVSPKKSCINWAFRTSCHLTGEKSYHCEFSNMCIRGFSHGSCNQLFYAAWFFVESGSSCTVWNQDSDWSTSKLSGNSDPEFLTCGYKDYRFFFWNVGESESGFYCRFIVLFLLN